jgi:hypothetical protein
MVKISLPCLSCDGRESELLPPQWYNHIRYRNQNLNMLLLIIFGFVQVPFITNMVTLPCQLTIMYTRYLILKLIHHLII